MFSLSLSIEETFIRLKQKNKKAFIGYIPFGYPTLNLSRKILLTLSQANIDILEIGLPFSDPLADGPIIQEANHMALKAGANPLLLFKMLQQLKNSIKIPIVILSYYNSIYKFSQKKFLTCAKESGVKGIMVVDLPVEEAKSYLRTARKVGIDTIFFITPTTSEKRAKQIVKVSQGFIYYISVTGITGPKHLYFSEIARHINQLRKITELPICVGFGIHKRSQIREIEKFCEGVIVGSVIVKFIKENYKKENFFSALKNFLVNLKGGA